MSKERELRILQAASELFAHYGYDKTTVSDIAREAGISKGALYLHFSSKESLFETLVIHESIQVMDEVLEQLAQDENSGTLFHFYSVALIKTSENPFIRAILARDQRVIGEMYQNMSKSQVYSEVRPFRKQFIESLQNNNIIRRDISAKTINYLLTAMRFGLVQINDMLEDDAIPTTEELNHDMPLFFIGALGGADLDQEIGRQIFLDLLTQYREILQNLKERITDRGT